MAALDFPATPTVGQKYPVPAVVGVPVYTWDGEKWTTIGGAIGSTGGADDLPLGDGTATAGVSTQWAREDHVHPRDASLAYSGMQINGGMEVSQELGNAGRTNSGYFCDGWSFVHLGTASLAIAQASSAFVAGFPNHILQWVNTAQATILSSQVIAVQSGIEGYRVARLSWGTANAQPITVGFWSGHARTGLYSGAIRNSTAPINRSYAFTYTQNVSSVPQYNVITVPGDTAGTWATNNTVGLSVSFAIACGTDYIAPSVNTWVAGNFVAASGQVNAVAATSDLFRITGVTVLPGTQAPTAAQSPNIMRPYDQELVTCKRYWQQLTNIVWSGYSSVGTTYFYTYTPWPVGMRAGPTLAIGSPSYGNASEAGIQGGTLTGTTLQAKLLGGGTQAVAIVGTLTGDARL